MQELFTITCADSLQCMAAMKSESVDLVVSSPPYNIGKAYEVRVELAAYAEWQGHILKEVVRTMRPGASLAWQVGNYVSKGEVVPLDMLFLPILMGEGLTLRNRFIWHFGHGLHARTRFSGRHETVLWLTKGGGFFYDPQIILPAGAPIPDDTSGIAPAVLEAMMTGCWDIPNVKHNHVEKIPDHPCQFPVALAERMVLGTSRPGDLVLDPFAGVGSAGVAAIAHGRRFMGIDRDPLYCSIARERLEGVKTGQTKWRRHDQEVTRPEAAAAFELPEP